MKICRARPQLIFTFANRFSSTGWAVPQSVRYRIFRLQGSYLSASSHTGRKSCRVKSLNMKRFWYKLCWNCTRLYNFSHLFVQAVLRWSHLADPELYRICNRAKRRQPVARKNSMNQYQSFSLYILVRLDRFCYSHWNLNSFLEVQAQNILF